MSADFTGKSGIITGAAGGIGRATALRLAKAGANLTLVDKNDGELIKLTRELEQYGVSISSLAADVTDPDSAAEYVEMALKHSGKIDFFFNNAGIEGPMRSVLDFDERDFTKVIDINLKGVFLGLRHVLPVMKNQGHGAVVNTGSLASERGLAGSIAYTAAKHGVLGLTRVAVADLVGTQVRVNSVLPGMVDTPLLRKIINDTFAGDMDKGVQGMGNVAPMKRLAQPEEIASAVVFLLSDDASFINGVALPVDGGTLAVVPYND